MPTGVNFPLTAVEHKSQCKRKSETVNLCVGYRVYHFGKQQAVNLV